MSNWIGYTDIQFESVHDVASSLVEALNVVEKYHKIETTVHFTQEGIVYPPSDPWARFIAQMKLIEEYNEV